MIGYQYNLGAENKQLEADFINSVKFSDLAQASVNGNPEQSEINTLNKQISKLQSDNANAPTVSENSYSGIVNEWSKRVGVISCSWYYQGQTQPYEQDIGSMTIDLINGRPGITALTNKHVVTDKNGYVPNYCVFYIPGIGTASSYYTQTNSPFFLFNDFDLADVSVGLNTNTIDPNDASISGLTAMQTVVNNHLNVCKLTDAQVGDKILVLGYPVDGSQSSITATQGIISGYDGQYYVTDAKIDHGNSGGAAVLIKDDCYLGIPSASVTGAIESYGRILSAKYVLEN